MQHCPILCDPQYIIPVSSHLKPVDIGPDLVDDPSGVLAGGVGQGGQVGVGAGTDVGVDRVHTCSLHPNQHLKVVLS